MTEPARMYVLTDAERAAIDALFISIKALPKTLYFSIDDFEVHGIEVWKRNPKRELSIAGKVAELKCKRAVEGP